MNLIGNFAYKSEFKSLNCVATSISNASSFILHKNDLGLSRRMQVTRHAVDFW